MFNFDCLTFIVVYMSKQTIYDLEPLLSYLQDQKAQARKYTLLLLSFLSISQGKYCQLYLW